MLAGWPDRPPGSHLFTASNPPANKTTHPTTNTIKNLTRTAGKILCFIALNRMNPTQIYPAFRMRSRALDHEGVMRKLSSMLLTITANRCVGTAKVSTPACTTVRAETSNIPSTQRGCGLAISSKRYDTIVAQPEMLEVGAQLGREACVSLAAHAAGSFHVIDQRLTFPHAVQLADQTIFTAACGNQRRVRRLIGVIPGDGEFSSGEILLPLCHEVLLVGQVHATMLFPRRGAVNAGAAAHHRTSAMMICAGVKPASTMPVRMTRYHPLETARVSSQRMKERELHYPSM